MTGKQKLFVDYYLGQARCNATEAARLAGYSCPMQQGHETLRNLEIQEAIKVRTAEVAGTADEVLKTLADHMRGPTPDCFTEAGELDPERLREAGKLHLVRETKRDKDGNLTVKLYDAQAAAVHLGKHHGVLKESGDVNVNGRLVIEVEHVDGHSKSGPGADRPAETASRATTAD